MALRLNNLHLTREFISEDDPDQTADEGATVFHIRQLKSYELAFLSDKMAAFKMDSLETEEGSAKSRKKKRKGNAGTQTTTLAIHEVALNAVRMAVTNIENMLDGQGNAIETIELVKGRVAGKTVMVLPDYIMDAFDPDVAMEIYQFIEEDQDISDDDRKK